MINRMINDINKALDAGAYMAALSLALTLPDICTKAEFGLSINNNKEKYIKWYQENICILDNGPWRDKDIGGTYLSGEVVYELRCSFLHQGSISINANKIKNDSCRINNFELEVGKKKSGFYYDILTKVDVIIDGEVSSKSVNYRINVIKLCQKIVEGVRIYWEKHRVNFCFDINVIDNGDDIIDKE